MIEVDEYIRINKSFKRRFLFRVGANSGLYSEINNMLLSMAWCWNRDIQFVLDSKYANFGIGNGWTDIFKPFCDEFVMVDKGFDDYVNPRQITSMDSGRKGVVKRFKNDNNFDFLTNDVFSQIRKESYRSRSQCFQEMVDFASIAYRFNDEVSARISGMVSEAIVPDRFTGFHIRRGDKSVEAAHRDVSEYVQAANSRPNNRYGYVMCDDLRVYDEIVFNNTDWTFTIDGSMSYGNGYNHWEFVHLPVDIRFEKILRLLADIEIMKKAEFVVGTMSSNIGVFLPVYMNDQSRFIGVDSNRWIVF